VTQPESLAAAPGELRGVSCALAATQFVATTLAANATVAG
jgi:hypothetical protein